MARLRITIFLLAFTFLLSGQGRPQTQAASPAEYAFWGRGERKKRVKPSRAKPAPEDKATPHIEPVQPVQPAREAEEVQQSKQQRIRLVENADSAKISLNIKDMDILDLLKLFSQESKLNIIAEKDVRGKVTIFLKDVEIMDALEIILEANHLTYEKKRNIIKVMTEKQYRAIYGKGFQDKTASQIIKLHYAGATNVSNALKQVLSKVGKTIVNEESNTIIIIDTPEKLQEMEKLVLEMDALPVTHIFSLNYATAKDIEPELEKMLTPGIGKLKLDERTNKLVITDTQEKVDAVKKVVFAFDERNKQVCIEAKIVEVTLNDDFAFGIDWSSVISSEFQLDRNLNISLPDTSATIVGTFAAKKFSGALRMLKEFGKTDVLSSPQITTINNQEARIMVGKRDAYITAAVSTTGETTTTAPTVNFIDVGVTLAVTPVINDDGFITIEVKPEVSSLEKYITLSDSEQREIAKVPVVRTSEASTTLTVKDGSTILIAGLMKEKLATKINRVPLLGHIPLLGLLFTNKSEEKEKVELVIFLTPHIITGEVSSAEADKYPSPLKHNPMHK